jgi:hypothetical protein
MTISAKSIAAGTTTACHSSNRKQQTMTDPLKTPKPSAPGRLPEEACEILRAVTKAKGNRAEQTAAVHKAIDEVARRWPEYFRKGGQR